MQRENRRSSPRGPILAPMCHRRAGAAYPTQWNGTSHQSKAPALAFTGRNGVSARILARGLGHCRSFLPGLVQPPASRQPPRTEATTGNAARLRNDSASTMYARYATWLNFVFVHSKRRRLLAMICRRAYLPPPLCVHHQNACFATLLVRRTEVCPVNICQPTRWPPSAPTRLERSWRAWPPATWLTVGELSISLVAY